MIATFKETIKSLRDVKYGKEIVKKSVGQALWYWTKYLLLIVGVGVVLAVAALTYYTPQLAKLAMVNLPDVTLSVKDGQVSTDVPQPFVRGDDNFLFIIDTKGSVDNLDKAKAGVLILGDKIVTKSERETRIVSLQDVQDFTTSKSLVVAWINTHQMTIFGLGLALILTTVAVLGGLFWLWEVAGFALWALVLLLAAKLMKKNLLYINAFKIAAYASVISLLIRALTLFSGGAILSLLALAAFLFYALSWIKNG